MEEEKSKMKNLQQKSHEALLKLLNNIGIVGSIIICVFEIILIILFVTGINFNKDKNSQLLYSLLNGFSGIMINILLRYQGRRYAELENKELCEKYYRKKIKEKKHLSMKKWEIVCAIKDIIFKGVSITTGLFVVVHIAIQGTKNFSYVLLTIGILALFICFGLVNMNSAYDRFYRIEIPIMEEKINEKEYHRDGTL